jgi:hypothetical protein
MAAFKLGGGEGFESEPKSSDFGWTAGVAADAGRWHFDMRYTAGLGEVLPSPDSKYKTRSLTLMAGFRVK